MKTRPSTHRGGAGWFALPRTSTERLPGGVLVQAVMRDSTRQAEFPSIHEEVM